MTPTPTPTLPLLDHPTSTYASLISQSTVLLPSFTLESGETLTDVPVAYKTWGKLNERGDNCMVVCHALTGSADVEDWWGPLLGPGKSFDTTRYFIFCANVIGSPYGTISSVTTIPSTLSPFPRVYGPTLPLSSIKDDVRLQYLVLRSLGVTSVAVVVGGSMGGMTTLEYPLNTPPGFVRNIVPLATSARHSAWCISWGEAQRQSIYSDPAYEDGWYCFAGGEDGGAVDLRDKQPTRGLAAARMAALLTYRSRDSFESRFGRKSGTRGGKPGKGGSPGARPDAISIPSGPSSPSEEAWKAHNDGHRTRTRNGSQSGFMYPSSGTSTPVGSAPQSGTIPITIPNPLELAGSGTNIELSMPGGGGSRTLVEAFEAGKMGTGASRTPQVFSAQSYLRYQGDKFTSRYDANCYIHITRKLDSHDISHPSTALTEPRTLSSQLPETLDDPTEAQQTASLAHALSLLPPALVIGIESDGLFTTREQREIAEFIPEAELVIIPSPDGHDGFLLEFEAIEGCVKTWLRKRLPEIYEGPPLVDEAAEAEQGEDAWKVKKESVFGEAEADVTRW